MRKPRGPVKINRDFRLGQGVAGAWLLGTNRTLVSYLSVPLPQEPTIIGSTILLAEDNHNNPVLDFTGTATSDRIDIGVIPLGHPLQGGPEMAIYFRFEDPGDAGTNNFWRLIDKSDGTFGAQGYAIWIDAAGPEDFYFYIDSVLNSNVGNLTGSGWHTGCLIRTNGTTTWVIDGAIFGAAEQTSTTPIDNAATSLAIGNWNHTTGREWNGMLDYVVVSLTPPTIEEAIFLTRPGNEYLLFTPPRPALVFTFSPPATSDASVTLTGTASTSAIGSLTVTGGASQTLTGVSSTTSLGALTATGAASTTLAGVASTAAGGAVSATGAASIALAGVASTGAAGTLSALGAALVALSGVVSTTSPGTLTINVEGAVSVTLAGASAAGAAGTVSPAGAASVSLTGSAATASAGDLSILLGAFVTLAGVDSTTAAGVISAVGAAVAQLTGAATTSAAGTVTIPVVVPGGRLVGTITVESSLTGTISVHS